MSEPLTELERADMIVERLSKNPRIAKVVADARLFDALRHDPGWQRLFERVRARKDRWQLDIAKRLMGPQTRWPTPEEIAYNQGFYQGAVFVLAHPEHAEKNLEHAAQVAWAMTYEEDTQTQEG